MSKIYIYHADPGRLRRLESTIRAYYEAIGRNKRLELFSDSGEAMGWLRKNSGVPDILFVDCRNRTMAENMAELVRADNLRASWVYVDGTIDGLCETLIHRPSAYLRDASDTEQILPVIRQLEDYHRAMQKKRDFIFKFEGDYVYIPFSNICYFESSAKRVTLHLRDRSKMYHFTAKLEEIQKKLPDTFLRCHQSYLVNLEEVRRLDAREHLFIMNNNEDVLISRRMYAAAKERYEQFLEVCREQILG